jgi:hypothetical protein
MHSYAGKRGLLADEFQMSLRKISIKIFFGHDSNFIVKLLENIIVNDCIIVKGRAEVKSITRYST